MSPCPFPMAITITLRAPPYIGYKGGNILGLSDNSNEAATNAFAFMLSNVF